MKYLVLAAALLAATPAAAVNLVANGNFSVGNTAFSAPDYTYVAPGNYGGAIGEALYAIDTNALNTHFAWASFADHTGDAAGLYMIVNGSGASSVVWQQSITVAALTEYSFSAFAANLCCNANQAPPNFSELSLQADDGTGFVTIGGITLSGVGAWLPTSGLYTTGAVTGLTLRIINTNTELAGNDFALDDISFESTAAVPEAPTWAMLIAGFGLVGATMRRRERAVAA